ncbi:MAG TPA: ABC transporter ATP-binding protein [Fimbriiglobus sp.]|nr:ABC transporter ATP-binding protein [Fimbriiglobus sp.]
MLQADNLFKSYRRHADAVKVLQGLNLAVADGEFLSIVGASGSGKSTLLHLLGTLDAPDAGAISLDGRRIDDLRGRDRDELRNKTFGFIFQFYHLLPELSALDNVLMPAYIAHSTAGWWRARRQWRRRAQELLERVGLGHRVRHKPRELSGGEMQRAAVARALLSRPRVLLADEPTGNLDTDTGGEIVRLLRELNRDDGVTVVMVTHNLEIAAVTDRVVRMSHGRVAEDGPDSFRPRLMTAV